MSFGSLVPALAAQTRGDRAAPTRVRAPTSSSCPSLRKHPGQVTHLDLGQVTQKSELQVLSLTGSIVKDIKQRQPWAKAVKVEAAAPTGLALLCWEWEMGFTRWFGVWLGELCSCVGLTRQGREKRMSSATRGGQEWRWAPSTGMGMCIWQPPNTSSAEAGGAVCPSQAALSLGTLPRTGQGAVSLPTQWCDMPAQQYFRLPTRVTVALSKARPSLLPGSRLISSPPCASGLHP